MCKKWMMNWFKIGFWTILACPKNDILSKLLLGIWICFESFWTILAGKLVWQKNSVNAHNNCFYFSNFSQIFLSNQHCVSCDMKTKVSLTEKFCQSTQQLLLLYWFFSNFLSNQHCVSCDMKTKVSLTENFLSKWANLEFFTPNGRDISEMGLNFGTLQKNFYNFPRRFENRGLFWTNLDDF